MKSGSLKKSIWQKSFSLLVLFAFTMNLFSQQTATDDKVYDMVAHLPYFVSSESSEDVPSILRHISKNIKYPEDAWDLEKQGIVVCEFVINKDGSISDVRVKRGRGVYPSLDREAVRVISTFPKWHPGKNEEGESVRTRYALPVRFFMREFAQ